VKMYQDCNKTIFIFAVFVVSLSLTPSVKCSVFYINIYIGLWQILEAGARRESVGQFPV